MNDIIKQKFTDHIQMQIANAELLLEPLDHATQVIVSSLLQGGKIICCAEPEAEFLVNYFVNCLLNQFETERPSLPAISLTSQSGFFNDQTSLYAHQLKALGQQTDCLVVIVNSGHDQRILRVIETAVAMDIHVIALLSDGAMDQCGGLFNHEDVIIQIPSNALGHLHESYLIVLHSLLQLIDNTLFMQYEG